MKRRFAMIIIVIWVGAGSIFPAAVRSSLMEDAGAGVSPSTPLVSTESSPERSPAPSPSKGGWRGRIHLNPSLQFETKADQGTIPSEREAEAIRFHQNNLLNRFQNADSQGQIFLSFFANRVELMFRSVSGAEAPVVGLDLTPEP